MTQTATLTALKPSSDRKVQQRTNQKNCYGLLPGLSGSCPGATQGEGGCSWVKPGKKNAVCYVDGLMKAYTGVRGILQHNTDLMMKADKAEKQRLLEAEFRRYHTAELRYEKRKGVKPWLNYRLHWSGDFFDEEYVYAATAAMRNVPELQYWVYTRSLFAVKTLSLAPNLMTYISLDPVNMREGLDTFYTWEQDKKHDNVQVCYLSPTKENDFVEWWRNASKTTKLKIWPDEPMKMSPCPVDVGKLPLQNGCTVCQKCLGLRQKLVPIWFCP